MSDEFPLEAGLVEERRCSFCKKTRECKSTRWDSSLHMWPCNECRNELKVAVIRNLAPIQRRKAPERALRWVGGARPFDHRIKSLGKGAYIGTAAYISAIGLNRLFSQSANTASVILYCPFIGRSITP